MNELIGRLHPLLVHLPAGVLLIACLAGYAVSRGKWQRLGNPLAWLFAAGSLGALLSVWSGLQLAQQGSYEADTLGWHKWLGIGTAALSAFLAWQVLRRPLERPSGPIFLIPNTLLLLLIFATGHLGGSLTHGPEFLAERSPRWIQRIAGYEPFRAASADLSRSDSAQIYRHLIQPVLDQSCAGCHRPGRMNGGLDLSSPEAIAKGGISGPVIRPGNPQESELFHRVALPAHHPKFMPTSGPALTFEQVQLLEWWIAAGASYDQQIQDAERSPAISRILEQHYRWTPAGDNPLAGLNLPAAPPSAALLDSLRGLGFIIKPVAHDESALEVMPAKSGVQVRTEQVAALLRIREQIVWLNLAGAQVQDGALQHIARMPNLVKLRLERNPVSDAGIAGLAGLRHLRSLNLFSTGVTDAGLRSLAAAESLQTIYLGGTRATPGGISALQAAQPGLQIVTGNP
ncbi:MAG: c-type cytochrome domain-containing protein [Bacteroidia bacterium]|nr:c-type cytochrome domain-containing protein [Bacteroidia bacterium]